MAYCVQGRRLSRATPGACSLLSGSSTSSTFQLCAPQASCPTYSDTFWKGLPHTGHREESQDALPAARPPEVQQSTSAQGRHGLGFPRPLRWGQVGDRDDLRLLVVDNEAEEVPVLRGPVSLPLEEDAIGLGDVGDEAQGLGLACREKAGFGWGVVALLGVPPSPYSQDARSPLVRGLISALFCRPLVPVTSSMR